MAPMHATFFLTFILTMVVRCVWAETHTITEYYTVTGMFTIRASGLILWLMNRCGHGTRKDTLTAAVNPTGQHIVNWQAFQVKRPIHLWNCWWRGFPDNKNKIGTGDCLLNGEGCSLVEMTLVNPTCAGCGSSTDISLIPPYSGGCSGQGATCTSATCKTAFFVPDDNQVQVECQEEDVDLLITFCPGATGGGTPPKASSSVIQATPTKASIGSTTESLTQVIAAPTSSGSAKASQIASAPSTPVPVPNAPKCATKRATRRRRGVPVPVSEESQRHRRGGLRMAHAHSNARKDF
ncbi:hypothetical protein CVT25_015866 [Psilocybe cyanescens]|uniref:Uncharacterized protein n=1 Tax=Psilocybe cyanescens TaxID=93625 RepID=A0A409XIG8_PSICY|nr:hypothetical protein CVT25_015866 [Psilocybe cyanescens]